jgi:hypothetical protein
MALKCYWRQEHCTDHKIQHRIADLDALRGERPQSAHIYSNRGQQLLRFKHGPDVNFVKQWC